MRTSFLHLICILIITTVATAQTGFRFVDGPDSIISTRQQLDELGINSISCKVQSSLLEFRINEYVKHYSGRAPYVQLHDNVDDFSMVLSPDKGTQYVLPELKIEYDKIKILEPWYGRMDSASIDISETCILVTKSIDQNYGISESNAVSDTARTIELKSFDTDTTIFLNTNRGLVEIECFKDGHWAIHKQPWIEEATKIEYYLIENSIEKYEFERIIYFDSMILTHFKSYTKIEDIYLLTQLIVKDVNPITSQERLLNDITFTNYVIER